VDRIAEEYTKGTSIVSLAISNNYPPYLFSRILVEGISNVGKQALTDSMRDPVGHLGDPSVIDAKYLSSETIKRSDDAPRYMITLPFCFVLPMCMTHPMTNSWIFQD
jgi:hypothetical protein